MRTLAAIAAFALLGVTTARAQEEPPVARAQAEEQERDEAQPRPHIQVLQHPYEISSFYRSSQGDGVDFGYEPSVSTDRYPIAGFYRSGGAARGRYSMFWTNGYGGGRGATRGRGLIGSPRHRALGLNGDLFLFAPTVLGPVGPLTGAFFER